MGGGLSITMGGDLSKKTDEQLIAEAGAGLLGQMRPHLRILIHRHQHLRLKIDQTGRSNRGRVTYEFRLADRNMRNDAPRQRLDPTAGARATR